MGIKGVRIVEFGECSHRILASEQCLGGGREFFLGRHQAEATQLG